MAYKCALLCIHGMGNLIERDFRKDIAKLKKNISERLSESTMNEIYIPDSGVFYSALTQDQEDAVWEEMEGHGGINTGILRRNTTNKIRRFILSGFSDATAFIGFNSVIPIQQYMKVQNIIYAALEDIYTKCGNVPVVIISQSLGSQILSNYIWDAQTSNPKSKFNKNINPSSIWHNATTGVKDNFMRLQKLTTWFTTGCNIPIFVSGFENVRAIHNQQDGYAFKWFNYYDYDDILGYPLKPLGKLFDDNDSAHGQSYKYAVEDIQVNANNGIGGAITSSWNPMSHTQYWSDKKILDDLSEILKKI